MSGLTIKQGLLAMAASLAFAATAMAGPGDVHKVSGERANLRAGPSGQAAVRGQVLQGDEVIELTQQGRWLGVRVSRTGEEGWIYGDLVRRVAQSTLSRPASAAGFGRYSRDFDNLIEAINTEIGMPMVAAIDQGANNTLRVTPTSDWMLSTGRAAKLYAALALYQFWKNASTGRPANVALILNGSSYITVTDTNTGPVLATESPKLGVVSGSAR